MFLLSNLIYIYIYMMIYKQKKGLWEIHWLKLSTWQHLESPRKQASEHACESLSVQVSWDGKTSESLDSTSTGWGSTVDKWRKWTVRAFIALCFLTVIAIWPASSGFCCHNFPAMKDWLDPLKFYMSSGFFFFFPFLWQQLEK